MTVSNNKNYKDYKNRNNNNIASVVCYRQLLQCTYINGNKLQFSANIQNVHPFDSTAFFAAAFSVVCDMLLIIDELN